jgi:hypothetical protein
MSWIRLWTLELLTAYAIIGGTNLVVTIIVAAVWTAIFGLACDLVVDIAFAQRVGGGRFWKRGREDPRKGRSEGQKTQKALGKTHDE